MAQYCNEHGIDALAIGDFNSWRNATGIEVNLHRASLADAFSTGIDNRSSRARYSRA